MSVQFQVGDKVLVRLSTRAGIDPEPIVTKVRMVSPGGRPSIVSKDPGGNDRKIRFNPSKSWKYFGEFEGCPVVGEKHGSFEGAQLYHHSDELIQAIEEKRAGQRAQLEERKRADAEKKQQRQDRLDAELAEVKEAWAVKELTELRDPLSYADVMPDGSRLYMIDMPIHPNYSERKCGWERIIVRCKDAEAYNFMLARQTGNDEDALVKVVEADMTYVNGSSSSFASCSIARHSNDEEAVWEAMRRQYFSW